MIDLEAVLRSLQGRTFYRNATINNITNVEVRENEVEDKNGDATFILISENNETERYDWWKDEVFIEELDIKGADYSQLKTFFKDHKPSVDTAIGKIVGLEVVKNELIGSVVFGTDKDSQVIKQKYDDGILTDVSIGYRINEIVSTEKKDEPNHVLVTDYTIVELSAVWKGADAGAVKIKTDNTTKATEKRFSYDLYEKKLKIKGKR